MAEEELMDKKEVQELKKELENIKTILLLEMPFFASLLRRCRIILDEQAKRASVNTLGEIRVEPEFFKSLSKKAKIWVYCHETAHIAFRHLLRAENKDLELFNVAADTPINHILENHGFKNIKIPGGIILPSQLVKIISKTEEEIVKMSPEEIYSLLQKNAKEHPPLEFMKDLLDDSKDDSSSGKTIIIQEGDPEAYKSRNPKQMDNYWKEKIAQAMVESKMAGKLPGNLERLVDELLRSRVRWKQIIKKEIINGIGKTIVSDWKMPSRRYKSFPGTKRLNMPNIWFLIDTSGSIGKPELQQFLGEVYAILKNHAQGIVIPWDAKVYPMTELNKPKDIELAVKNMRGGGGTIIFPALETTLKLMRLGDMVIILTDGCIFDADKPGTKELFKKVGQKSIVAIFATIQTQIDLPLKWKKIKIE